MNFSLYSINWFIIVKYSSGIWKQKYKHFYLHMSQSRNSKNK